MFALSGISSIQKTSEKISSVEKNILTSTPLSSLSESEASSWGQNLAILAYGNQDIINNAS